MSSKSSRSRALLRWRNRTSTNKRKTNKMKNEQVIEASNIAMPVRGEMDTGNNNPNVICMANSSRFAELNFSQPLTDYSLGWGKANPMLDEMLEFVAPMVKTPKRFEYRQGTNAQYYLSETDDIRAIGSDFKLVQYYGALTSSRTFNKGLTVRIDAEESEGNPTIEQETVDKLMKRLKLNDFRRAITALDAIDTNVAVTWDTTAGKDPDADLMASVILGNTDIGNSGLNRAIFGITAWQKRFLSLSGQAGLGSGSRSALTVEQVATLVGLDQIKVSREVWASGGAALTTKSQVVGATRIFVFNATSGAGKDDPSTIKRFVSMTDGGGEYKVYRHEVSAKLTDITVEHHSNIVATSDLGVRGITVS